MVFKININDLLKCYGYNVVIKELSIHYDNTANNSICDGLLNGNKILINDFVKIWYQGRKRPKYLRVRVNDVTPIPLSDDVFRVNEWRIVNRTDEGEVLRNRDIIVIKDNNGKFYLKTIDGKVYLDYVSDLQHLMFAFKMNY